MLFNSYKDNYTMSDDLYLKNTKVSLGSISAILLSKNLVPYASSSAAEDKGTSIMKMYSEHLERSNIGFMYKQSSKLEKFDLISNEISTVPKNQLSYGPSNMHGYVDTTGSASRPDNSNVLIKKAVSELIEKNELFLFWYLNRGEKISGDNLMVKDALEKYGMSSYQNYLFKSTNLSSWPTIICVSYKNDQILSTGICCNENERVAIEGAVCESKILKTLNSYKYNDLYRFDSITNRSIQNFLHSYNEEPTNNKYSIKLKKYNLSLNKSIEDLSISLISPIAGNKGKIVSAFSSSLIKCLPTKKNLKYCMNVPIIKSSNMKNFDRSIDCFIS